MKKAHYRRIPIYFNEETSEFYGRNWFYKILVNINVWIDFQVLGVEELPIWVETNEDET